MYLVRLIYTSEISDGFGPGDIENILEKAKQNNSKMNVTGLLCFNTTHFLQCLEGSRSAVNATYHRILNDTRHKNIIMLNYCEIFEREFENWSMGYIPYSRLVTPITLKYSGRSEFNPLAMSAGSAHKLMLALRGLLLKS
ncbi:blue light sensor protein [Pseudoalteromonas sp. S4389]|uniref:BLUF domain-containing protein n=1 Tax=Pseudoalteromonas sp. S4389 TaxID=579556 RepID=UPI001108C395|nr:BLUF domain-containing protein [Pseudoalteromonas sp. S4389]TMO47332.1 blue light sensor protein [Pseudoalteromonas sp. S4389]